MSREIENEVTEKVIQKLENNDYFEKPVNKVKYTEEGSPYVDSEQKSCSFDDLPDDYQEMLLKYLGPIGEAVVEVVEEKLDERGVSSDG